MIWVTRCTKNIVHGQKVECETRHPSSHRGTRDHQVTLIVVRIRDAKTVHLVEAKRGVSSSHNLNGTNRLMDSQNRG